MNMLRARLYNYEIKKREDKTKNIENAKSDIGWGHQIRSYVLHPYRLVKDNRTNYESSNPDKILDGDLDEFLESNLYNLNA
jgi:peptide chain release factor 2